MATEQAGGGTTPPPAEDQITKNLKAEMERKFSNIQTDLKKSSDALAAQLASLAERLPAAKPTTPDPKDLEREMWDNPAAFKQRIVKEATEQADQRFNSYTQQQQMATKQLSELYTQYPELQTTGHPLATRSVEIYNTMSAEEKTSPHAFKLAVVQAASEHGIKPITKREESELDDHQLKATGKTRKAGPKIPQNTELFAQAMGIDLSNEKTRKEIETYAAYTPEQWRKWK